MNIDVVMWVWLFWRFIFNVMGIGIFSFGVFLGFEVWIMGDILVEKLNFGIDLDSLF